MALSASSSVESVARSDSSSTGISETMSNEIVHVPTVRENIVGHAIRDDLWTSSTSFVNYTRPHLPAYYGSLAGSVPKKPCKIPNSFGFPLRLQRSLLLFVCCLLAFLCTLLLLVLSDSLPTCVCWIISVLWIAVLAVVGWPLARYCLFCALETERQVQKVGLRPQRIIIVRHAESQGNSDLNKYATTPDNQIELTPFGVDQARELGKQLKALVGNESCRFFVSPYKRTWQTLAHLLETMKPSLYTIREEPRVREQDWGNFQTEPGLIQRQIEERRRFGAFFYRMQSGESGADVYARIDSFWSSLFREFQANHCLENFIIVTHGITSRLLLMRYFGWTVDEFHSLHNFDNTQFAVLERKENSKRYTLVTPVKKNPHRLSPQMIAAQVSPLQHQPSI